MYACGCVLAYADKRLTILIFYLYYVYSDVYWRGGEPGLGFQVSHNVTYLVLCWRYSALSVLLDVLVPYKQGVACLMLVCMLPPHVQAPSKNRQQRQQKQKQPKAGSSSSSSSGGQLPAASAPSSVIPSHRPLPEPAPLLQPAGPVPAPPHDDPGEVRPAVPGWARGGGAKQVWMLSTTTFT